MFIELDLTTVPPGVTLHEPEDLGSFSVIVAKADHAYVDPSTLVELAGERGADPQWRSGMESMVRYAESKGWVSDDGAIRAHVEWR